MFLRRRPFGIGLPKPCQAAPPPLQERQYYHKTDRDCSTATRRPRRRPRRTTTVWGKFPRQQRRPKISLTTTFFQSVVEAGTFTPHVQHGHKLLELLRISEIPATPARARPNTTTSSRSVAAISPASRAARPARSRWADGPRRAARRAPAPRPHTHWRGRHNGCRFCWTPPSARDRRKRSIPSTPASIVRRMSKNGTNRAGGTG